jgi:eukaryotic-like serine/threonine-protein kinase
MRAPDTDPREPERGRVRLSWILAIAGILLLFAAIGLAAWATPPALLLPLRRPLVPALQWAKANWLSIPAIGTAAAVAGVLVPFVIRWLDRRRSLETDRAGRDVQERAVMLRRVRYKWITGVLEPSLARAAQLVLGLERRPDLLALGARTIHHPGRPAHPLPTGMPISEVFDTVGGGLLILGAPGAGKTTMLLQLAEELLDRAERNPHQPIPIVFNLASWAHSRPPLEAWLVEELVSSYQVPRQIATTWLQLDTLALLLDGLDEVAETHRNACAEAINTWRAEHGLVPLVICSRTQELQALAARLRLEEAIELQPPDELQVNRYLGYLEATGTPMGELRAALARDEELRDLLSSPLLLHVVALAYHGRAASALYAEGTTSERQARLWAAYLARMFEQRPLDSGAGYDDQQAVTWLAWLARVLRERDQTEFHLDRLEPEWLPTPTYQQQARLVTGVTIGTIYGLALGLGFRLAAIAAGTVDALIDDPAVGLALALFGGIAWGLVGGLTFRLAVTVQPAEPKRWSWSSLLAGPASWRGGRRLERDTEIDRPAISLAVAAVLGVSAGLAAAVLTGLLGGVIFGLIDGLTIALTTGIGAAVLGRLASVIEPAEEMRWSWPKLRAGLTRAMLAVLLGALTVGVYGVMTGDVAAGLALGPGYGLALGLVVGLSAGLVSGLRQERAAPNEGIHRSIRHSLRAGLLAGLLSGSAVTILFGLVRGTTAGAMVGMAYALIFTLTVGLLFGGTAVVQHYVVRAFLVRARVAPRRYDAFLEAMVERLLLRRGGNAYLFVHRLLRDHLAEPDPDRVQAAA